ncbi:GH92 family glycosyl hydrolase [Arcicella aquatica]|uniref:GH92 family glycosyl hydrolase n=1 Tax=Arcicella aquatica TaxID=217141 RepID=A0ABU5QMS2_9BACT|nr:GH92 family glycosyl hydrolase [Arcicella aquatica]MEA5258361.1 GH92 family glycosyl hydrolase [Arcicella aquatica]
MKKIGILLIALLYLNSSLAQTSPIDEVEPRIGTAHCRWFHFAPGALPFGMAKPGPSTNGHLGNKDGWEATGYDYRDNSIEGFPNFHEFQLGGIVFMPTTGKLVTTPATASNSLAGYRSTFERSTEIAKPGYYSVLLKDYKVKAEVTATKRVAFHRYTFPATDAANILFDIGNQQGESGRVKEAKVYMTEDGRIEGYVVTLPEYIQKYQHGADARMYFSAVLNKKPTTVGVFRGNEIFPNKTSIEGIGSGLYLRFSTNDQEAITIKAGLSYTSIENARLNLREEAQNLDFDQAHQQATLVWNDYLGRINIEGGLVKDRQKFYTGLYHALLGRGLASDVNGAYPKNDGSIGQIALDAQGKPQHQHYNTDAIWGAFWNLTQLWALAYPEYYSDYIKSQLLVYSDAGWLGDGIASSKYVSGVGTNFVGLIIAGAYMYGIRDFDIEKGYAASLKNELAYQNRPLGAGKDDVERFVKYGYVDHIDVDSLNREPSFSGSHTLEYSFSTYAVAQWAKALGKKQDYQQLIGLSKGWEKIFDPKTKLVRPKLKNGKFIDNFNPGQPWRGFQEGNAWQYTFYVPHQPDALVSKIGKTLFASRLDSIFSISQKSIFGGGQTIDAFAGLQGLYNHGNQPCLHIPWLFNYTHKPELTQKWVRAICNEFYGNEGIHGYGYGQDEDQGQLGAWYVLGAMGLFDVQGGASEKPTMQLSTPIFDKITIRLNQQYYQGKTFSIVTKNNQPDKIYIKQVKYNGKLLKHPSLLFEEITKGGVLEYSVF